MIKISDETYNKYSGKVNIPKKKEKPVGDFKSTPKSIKPPIVNNNVKINVPEELTKSIAYLSKLQIEATEKLAKAVEQSKQVPAEMVELLKELKDKPKTLIINRDSNNFIKTITIK